MEALTMFAYKFETLEDYVKDESKRYYNLSHRGILKWQIESFCYRHEVTVKSSDSRNEMLDKLFERDELVLEFYEEFQEFIGVGYHDYYQRFNLTKNEYQKLKRRDFFELHCYYDVKYKYGWTTFPSYSARQFFSVTREDIDKALSQPVPRKPRAKITD